MIVIRFFALLRADRATKYLKSHGHIGTRLIEVFDAIGLAAFTVVGVVVALDTLAQPLLLWGPIASARPCAASSILKLPPFGALPLPRSWSGRASGCNRTRSE